MSRRCLFSADRSQIAVAKFQFDVLPYSRERESIVDKICCSHQVVRDKRTGKTKGYGFVSFKDPNDYVRAMREMNGQSLHMHYTLSPACALTI